MSPDWLYRNIVEAWTFRASLPDFFRRLRWIYSEKLPKVLRPDEQIIRFRFPAPINQITVLVRSNGGSDAFIFGEVFHHRYYDLPLTATPVSILDLGANAGFTAVFFGRMYPDAKIACVEPIEGNVRLLRRNCEMNGVAASIFSGAVAIADGFLLMELDRMDFGHRVATQSNGNPDATVKVEAITVPTLLQRLGWTRIGLLKVDIEGYERVLFADDCPWLACVDAMCIECHEGFDDEDLKRLAQKHDFREPIRLPGTWFLGRG